MEEGRRLRICETCAVEFSYEIGRGKDRKHCSASCRRTTQLVRRAARFAALPTCSVDRCAMKATRRAAGLCEMHYSRRRRTGSTIGRVPTFKCVSRGYVRLRIDHPLAGKDGWVFEHRVIAFQKYGPGRQRCCWCDRELGWKEATVDHLNDIKDDNRPDNLAVSCNFCNRQRAQCRHFLEDLCATGRETFVKYVEGLSGRETSERRREHRAVEG